MNRMKTEFLYHYNRKNGLSLRERLFAYMPRYAPLVAKFGGLANLRDVIPGLSQLSEKLLGLTSKRELPQWDSQPFRPEETSQKTAGPEVVLFADSFNTYFEPQVLRDGLTVLEAAGRRVIVPRAKNTRRKLCCGRTFLSSGLIDEAKLEAVRLLENLSPYVERGVPIVGLEPSCVFTIKDELPSLLPGPQAQKLADHVQLLEEYLITENDAGRLSLKFRTSEPEKVLLHGHCHQKAFDAMDCTIKLLESVPGIEVETIHSGCCGMAGSFGYQAEHYEVSMEMAELSLLPRIRQATANEHIAACGTSCRHQIEHGSGRSVRHLTLNNCYKLIISIVYIFIQVCYNTVFFILKRTGWCSWTISLLSNRIRRKSSIPNLKAKPPNCFSTRLFSLATVPNRAAFSGCFRQGCSSLHGRLQDDAGFQRAPAPFRLPPRCRAAWVR